MIHDDNARQTKCMLLVLIISKIWHIMKRGDTGYFRTSCSTSKYNLLSLAVSHRLRAQIIYFKSTHLRGFFISVVFKSSHNSAYESEYNGEYSNLLGAREVSTIILTTHME